MKVAVVTPYYKEPLRKLKRCHDSVMNQTYACDHFMISDGHPKAALDAWRVFHIKVPHHNDYGDTPRVIGTASAAAMGYDAICLLDADNWFEPNHIETLVKVQQATKAPVITCPRILRRRDESILGIDGESDGQKFNDTNCYLITKEAYGMFRAWGFKDPSLGIVGDRVFWNTILENNLMRAHSQIPTVNYETTFAVHYKWNGEEPPADSKVIANFSDGTRRMVTYPEWVELYNKASAEGRVQPYTGI